MAAMTNIPSNSGLPKPADLLRTHQALWRSALPPDFLLRIQDLIQIVGEYSDYCLSQKETEDLCTFPQELLNYFKHQDGRMLTHENFPELPFFDFPRESDYNSWDVGLLDFSNPLSVLLPTKANNQKYSVMRHSYDDRIISLVVKFQFSSKNLQTDEDIDIANQLFDNTQYLSHEKEENKPIFVYVVIESACWKVKKGNKRKLEFTNIKICRKENFKDCVISF